MPIEFAPDDPIFHDESAAAAYVAQLRWPDGPFCPFCRETKAIVSHADAGAGPRHACGFCQRAFGITAGSMMARSAVPLPKWLRAFQLLEQERNGSVATVLRRQFEPTSRDPDLKLLVAGRAIRAFAVQSRRYSFNVPAQPSEVRIVSRHVIPHELDPDNRDVRRLGIDLLSISIEADGATRDVPYDHPGLIEGFYKPEAGHRWTNGRAVLPPACFDGITSDVIIRIQLGGMPQYA